MQSKWKSLEETIINTSLGFIFSFIIQIILNEAYEVEMSNRVAAHFVIWFTIASVVRGYLIRRFYNWKDKKNETGI